MVWIHGGYLLIASGSEPGYCPNEDLVRDSHIVHVSFNYRLNAFGFLALAELREVTGNYGLMDQMAALKWVQKNIQYFGGDPNKVTIYGQSSGEKSVLILNHCHNEQCGVLSYIYSLYSRNLQTHLSTLYKNIHTHTGRPMQSEANSPFFTGASLGLVSPGAVTLGDTPSNDPAEWIGSAD
ncbi:unnamed protein product [Staurois parvus]|uniref:Carboxylic ester hydrolase n=1 Tax=Staurois parvus TaxID=386267 RepID=A0ABN9GFY7_9NEOB|nr:unnamed protein product [Staurois parvus]